MVHLHVVVLQLSLLPSLEHVVGPLGTAASLAVDEAAPAPGREGPPAPPAAVHPGFFAFSVVVLQGINTGKEKDQWSWKQINFVLSIHLFLDFSSSIKFICHIQK